MQYYTQQTQQLVESTYNLYVNAHGKRRLSDDFTPGPYDVICARGKAAHNSEGNVRFRALVQEHAEQYGSCTCKYEKSKIVSHIVNTVRTAAAYHQGGFVKSTNGGTMWFEVGDRAAKEKIGQTFRDLLHTKYSSSTKAKARVRIQRRMGGTGDQDDDDDDDDEDHEESTVQKTKPLPFPNLKDITVKLRGSFSKTLRRGQSNNSPSADPAGSSGGGGGGSSAFMTGVNTMMAPFTGKQPRNRRSSVRLTPITPDVSSSSINTNNAVAPSTASAPQALTDSALMDALRSSVATVELPPDVYGTSTFNTGTPAKPFSASSASANWMTDSVLSNMSMVDMNISDATGQPPLDSVDIAGTSPTATDNIRPFGIFSSSTRNDPLRDPFGNPALLDSGTSGGGGAGRMASTNSRGSLSLSMMGSLPFDMQDMDVDALLDSMDSMGFQNMMVDQ